jgi:Tfp pilus assembly protein PilO
MKNVLQDIDNEMARQEHMKALQSVAKAATFKDGSKVEVLNPTPATDVTPVVEAIKETEKTTKRVEVTNPEVTVKNLGEITKTLQADLQEIQGKLDNFTDSVAVIKLQLPEQKMPEVVLDTTPVTDAVSRVEKAVSDLATGVQNIEFKPVINVPKPVVQAPDLSPITSEIAKLSRITSEKLSTLVDAANKPEEKEVEDEPVGYRFERNQDGELTKFVEVYADGREVVSTGWNIGYVNVEVSGAEPEDS